MTITVAIPNQSPTSLSFIPLSPDHFVITSLAWYDPSIDPLDLPATASCGALTLLKISGQLDGITIVQSLPTPSGVLCLHVSGSKIVTGSHDGYIRTYDIHLSNGNLSLHPSQEYNFFPDTPGITSIQFHPTLLSNLVCTTTLGGTHLIRLPRSQLQPAEACLRTDLGGMPSLYPRTAWATAWTPLPGPGREVSNSNGHGLYSVGGGGVIKSISWPTTQSFLASSPISSSEPPRNFHNGLAITGIANLMVPGRAPGHDIVLTCGLDGTLCVVDLSTKSGTRDGVLATLRVNDERGIIGVKIIKQLYVPDEDLEDRLLRHELEDIELAKQIETAEEEVDGDGDIDDSGMDMEDSEDEHEESELHSHSHDDDEEPFDADEYGESLNSGPWLKPRNYTFITGCLGVGPTLVALQCSPGKENGDWNERTWEMRSIAVFGDHKDELALVFDAYSHEGRMIGASATLSVINGVGAVRVCMWESQ